MKKKELIDYCNALKENKNQLIIAHTTPALN